MMKRKSINERIVSIFIGVAALVYMGYSTFGINLAEKDIMYFMYIVLIIPVVIVTVFGIYIGRGKTIIQSLPKLSIVGIAVFIGSCVSMLYMYNTGYVFEMLSNTATESSIVLNINDSVTLGTVIQQGLIFLVCGCIGTLVGNKSSKILQKVKN